MGLTQWFCSGEDNKYAKDQGPNSEHNHTTSTTTKENKGVMSAIAAMIFTRDAKDRAFLYREVSQRQRLSYADLDVLLDREEKALAKEAHKPEQNKEGEEEHKRARSDSSTSEDEADWHHTDRADSEEDLLIELEESELENVHTVTGAEDHLIKEIDHIVHSNITEGQLKRMKKMLDVNCLHRGDLAGTSGKRWMVAVDGTEASSRAFHGVLKLMDPEDHLLVVTVRDKNLPQRFALSPSEEVQLRFELWKSARHILKPYTDELAVRLESSRYTVIIPDSWDARRMLCKLCKRYNIDTLCVGKHAKGEHNHNHWHLRSLHRYTTKHAHCQVIVF